MSFLVTNCGYICWGSCLSCEMALDIWNIGDFFWLLYHEQISCLACLLNFLNRFWTHVGHFVRFLKNWSWFWCGFSLDSGPDFCQTGSKITQSLLYHFFLKTSHEIILIFCLKLETHIRKKLTEPCFAKIPNHSIS